MALIFCDGFDHYATAQILEKWSATDGNSAIVTNGREGQGLAPQNNGVTKNLPSNASTLVVGCARTATSINVDYMMFFQDRGTTQCGIVLNADGSVSAWDHSNQQIGTSSPGVILTNTFQYLEVKITFATSGSVAVRLNGVVLFSVSGVNTAGGTGNAYANSVTLRNASVYDDVYICDGTGTVNNDFLGDVKIVTLLPNGNGRVNQFARTGGTSSGNYTAVNEVPPDGDTSYVSSSTAGQIDAYTVSSLGTVASVKAAQIVAASRKDDAGTRVLAVGFGNGTTESYDAGTSLGSGYSMITRPLDKNPLTSAAWATGDFTSAQLALEVIS
jgi:hypothetical protein